MKKVIEYIQMNLDNKNLIIKNDSYIKYMS